MTTIAYPQPLVIEVVEFIDDEDWPWGSDDTDTEKVVEVLELPRQNFSAVPAHEVGIGPAPPLFLGSLDKARLWAQQLQQEAAAAALKGNSVATGPPPRRASKVKQPTSRLSTRRHLSIVNQALALPEDAGLSDYDEEEIFEEEEIIEEEYYDEEEYIEEEYMDMSYEEYYEEEVIEETAEEAKARQQLEAEIAEIERQIQEATKNKQQRVADGGVEETTKEKAERMANKSRLEACKKEKKELNFKQKAAARAKILEEKEKNWGKKGKKKEKDLAEIIAQKAKKQKKLLTRQKSKDGTKPQSRQPGIDAEKAKKEAAAKAAAAAEMEAAAPEKKQLSMADMLAAKMNKGVAGAHAGKAKPSQETQADPNDFGDEDLRAEDFLPSSDEEEEEEAEPELTPEEQHKKSLEWSKPTWTQAKLKTTTKGNKIKAGKTLSAPITFIPKKINEGLEEEDEDDAPSAGALMKGAMKMVVLPKAKKHQAGLKFTGNGARIRDGRKIEKPINTKSKKDKEEVKIWGADPDELKLTPRGLTARKGKGLSDDNITQATQIKKYQFEKPEWAKWKPEQLLKHTETGEALKEGEDIAPKITQATEEKKYEFEKPDWTKAKLKGTEAGQKVKSGAYLSAPIVNLDKKTINVNMEANPAFLKMTDQGEKLMEEGTLETPITAAPELARQRRDGQ